MPNRRLALAASGALLLVCCLALILLSGRYTYLNAGSGAIYRADRWTGEVVRIEGDRSYRVKNPMQTEAAEKAELEEQWRNEWATRREALEQGEASEKKQAERLRAWAAYKGPKPDTWTQKYLDPPAAATSHPPD